MTIKIRTFETEDARLYNVGDTCIPEAHNDFLEFLAKQKAKGHSHVSLTVIGNGISILLDFDLEKTPVHWRMPCCEIKIREEI
jgi:hypothetical protein